MLWLLLTLVVRSEIVEVTPESLATMLGQNQPQAFLVMFYSRWCEHSLILMNSVDDASALIAGIARVLKVDITNDIDTAETYSVSGYPSLRLFKAGQDSVEYEGIFAPRAIGVWVRRHVMSSQYMTFITTDNQISDLNKTSPFIVVSYFPSKGFFGWNSYSELARATLDMEFVWTNSTALAEKLGAPMTGLALHSDEGHFVYSGDLDDLDKVDRFLRMHRLPLVTHASFHNARRLLSDERNVMVLKSDSPLITESLREKWLFVVLGGYQPLIEFLGNSTDEVMVFIGGLTRRSNRFACADASSCLKEQWSRSITGTVEFLSENSHAKPLLVYFYAPWCIACVGFHKMFETLIAERLSYKVALSRMDCSVTQDVSVPFYPFIKLVRKPGSSGVDYPGDFDRADNVIDWVLARV